MEHQEASSLLGKRQGHPTSLRRGRQRQRPHECVQLNGISEAASVSPLNTQKPASGPSKRLKKGPNHDVRRTSIERRGPAPTETTLNDSTFKQTVLNITETSFGLENRRQSMIGKSLRRSCRHHIAFHQVDRRSNANECPNKDMERASFYVQSTEGVEVVPVPRSSVVVSLKKSRYLECATQSDPFLTVKMRQRENFQAPETTASSFFMFQTMRLFKNADRKMCCLRE